jgi:hypothetical protein
MPIANILDMSVIEIRAWQEWFIWKNESEKEQIQKARNRN